MLKKSWPKLCPKVIDIFTRITVSRLALTKRLISSGSWIWNHIERPELCAYNHTNFLGDASTVIGLQGALKFNGGGHINHSIFWQNLCPTSDSGEPSAELMAAIERDFGSLDSLKEKLSASTVAVQGSGNICNILFLKFRLEEVY